MSRSPRERELGSRESRRLVDGGATPKELLLLRVGIDEAPPNSAGRKRALAALGLAVGAGTLATSAKAAVALPKGVALAQAKWLLFGAVSAAVAVGTVQLATKPDPATSLAKSGSSGRKATTAVESTRPVESAEPQRPPPSSILVPGSAPPPVNNAPRSPAEAVTSPSELVAQVAALDGARAALRAGNPRQRVALLDKFERNFPRSSLASEATVVRVSALLALGQRARATKLVRAYCQNGDRRAYGHGLMALVGLSEKACEGSGPGP